MRNQNGFNLFQSTTDPLATRCSIVTPPAQLVAVISFRAYRHNRVFWNRDKICGKY